MRAVRQKKRPGSGTRFASRLPLSRAKQLSRKNAGNKNRDHHKSDDRDLGAAACRWWALTDLNRVALDFKPFSVCYLPGKACVLKRANLPFPGPKTRPNKVKCVKKCVTKTSDFHTLSISSKSQRGGVGTLGINSPLRYSATSTKPLSLSKNRASSQ